MTAPFIVLLAVFGPPALAYAMAARMRREEDWSYWIEQSCRHLDCRIKNARASGENVAVLCMIRAVRETQRGGWA